MKKYLALSMICVFGLSATSGTKKNDKKYDALLESVEQICDVASVKKLLRRVGPLNDAQKKELLEAAEDAVEESEQSISLLKSPSDQVKLVAGLVVFSCGGPFYKHTDFFKTKLGCKKDDSSIIAFRLMMAVVGGYCAWKGLKCSTARNRHENAEKLEEFIESIAVGDEK